MITFAYLCVVYAIDKSGEVFRIDIGVDSMTEISDVSSLAETANHLLGNCSYFLLELQYLNVKDR